MEERRRKLEELRRKKREIEELVNRSEKEKKEKFQNTKKPTNKMEYFKSDEVPGDKVSKYIKSKI